MRVRREVRNDLLSRYSVSQRALDAVARESANGQIWEASLPAFVITRKSTQEGLTLKVTKRLSTAICSALLVYAYTR